MKNEAKRPDVTASAVIINASIHDFRKGTRSRADRLLEALRPITDKWYVMFSDASVEGSDAVIEAYQEYRAEYIGTPDHPEDEIFRYTALAIILHSVRTDSFLDPNVRETTTALLKILFDQVCGQVEYWYPRQRFGEEMELFDYAKDIDSLCSTCDGLTNL